MNRYGRTAQQHWQTYAPSAVAALADPARFFTDLGAQAEAEVSDLAARIASLTRPCSTGPYLVEVARLQTARRTAEEVVMAELVWVREPELPLELAPREEWEQTRPSDENLIVWAERVQNFPDSMPSTDELEEMAKTWAVSVEFLEGLVATEPPRDYMAANQAALLEAANVRFWRELRPVHNR